MSSNISHDSLKQVNGCLFPNLLSDECIDYAMNYKPSNDDIFVATYPKCGTTWTQQIINLLFTDGVPNELGASYRWNNFLEGNGHKTIVKPSIKTHLPYGLLPMNTSAKYVVCFRNPKDTLVSAFNSMSDYRRFGDIHVFIDKWMGERMPYRGYFAHTLDYWTHRMDANILCLVYEQMKRNPKEGVLKIANFLGKEFVNKLMANNEMVLNQVLKYSSFDYMKVVFDKNYGPNFVRKGIVGDWRSHLTRDESNLIDEKFGKYFAGTELQDIWREDMKW